MLINHTPPQPPAKLIKVTERRSMDKNDNVVVKAVVSPEVPEPDLIANNDAILRHFRRLGIFQLHWINGKYETSDKKMLLYYLLWYLGGCTIVGIAFGLKEIFKWQCPQDYVDRINDVIEASFGCLFVMVLPALGNYLLKEYNTHLPQILMVVSKFEKTDLYKELKESEYLDDSKICYRDGFWNDDYDDEDDELNIESGLQKSCKEKWFTVKQCPLVWIIFSFIVCFILVLVAISIFIYEDVMSKRFKREFPAFFIAVLYPFKAYTSLWFCIFYLEWLRKVYSSIRKFIRKAKIKSKTNLKADFYKVIDILKILEKTFLLLNKKIFQKTIVMDFSLFIILGVIIVWKIINDPHNIAYIIPLGLITFHIYVICKWSNDLMSEYNETIEVLNEISFDDVKDLRTQFEKAPPQVLAFGGFKVNYKMMTAVIAFVLSIISISGMVWPHSDTEVCRFYTDQEGNTKELCIKDRISKILFENGTLQIITEKCYQYKNQEGISQRHCKEDKIIENF